jgi:predicted peptidase
MSTGFLDRSVTVDGTAYPYVVYVPRSYEPARRWPVILFLHGAGERGSDGLRATAIGLGSAIRFAPERFPAIVVFPQAPLQTRWLGEPVDAALLALDASMGEFHGDPERVYLTGLSMGGYGSWHLGLAQPERWAALVVVCGGLLAHPSTTAVRPSPLLPPAPADPYAFAAHALRHLPIRLFHGADDQIVPAEGSRRMDAELRKEGADVQYTEYPGVGHDSWTRAYGEEELWKWLFAQRRRAGPTSSSSR